MELKVFFHGIDVIEDIINNPRNNALHGGIIDNSLHGMGLPRRCLSICKDSSIIAAQDILKSKINFHYGLKKYQPFTMFLAVAS